MNDAFFLIYYMTRALLLFCRAYMSEELFLNRQEQSPYLLFQMFLKIEIVTILTMNNYIRAEVA